MLQNQSGSFSCNPESQISNLQLPDFYKFPNLHHLFILQFYEINALRQGADIDLGFGFIKLPFKHLFPFQIKN